MVPSSLTLFPLSGLEGLPVLMGGCVCVCAHLKFRSLTENLVSMMPVVFTRDRSTSCSLGRYPGAVILSSWFR